VNYIMSSLIHRKQRTIPAPSGNLTHRSVRAREWRGLPGDYSSLKTDTHVTADTFRFEYISKMETSVAGTAFHPINHETIDNRIHGSNPDWSNDGRELYTYILRGENLGSGIEPITWEFPTRYVLSEVFAAYPDLRFRPDFNRFGWQHRYDNASQKISQFKPSLSTGFSLVNFILQWRDIEHVYERYLKPLSARNKRGKTWVMPGKIRDLIIQSHAAPTPGLRKAADEWLSFTYGTRQLFRDIYTILHIFVSWKRDADKFLEGVGKTRFISDTLYSTPLTQQVLPLSRAFPCSVFGASGTSVLRYALQEYIFLRRSCTLAYQYSVPKLPGVIARISQFLDALGVNLDGSIPWDAIPFSFVLDWFLNVGEWLHANRIDWNQAKFTFKETGSSARLFNTRTILLQHLVTDVGILPADQTLFETTIHEYERRLFDLPDILLPQVQNKEKWSITRILNATALSVQKVLRKQPTQWWSSRSPII
jgi:hypothetical protein